MVEWAVWAVAAVAAFFALEVRAIARGTPTLTAVVRELASKYPWIGVVVSGAATLLLAHFFLGLW